MMCADANVSDNVRNLEQPTVTKRKNMQTPHKYHKDIPFFAVMQPSLITGSLCVPCQHKTKCDKASTQRLMFEDTLRPQPNNNKIWRVTGVNFPTQLHSLKRPFNKPLQRCHLFE